MDRFFFFLPKFLSSRNRKKYQRLQATIRIQAHIRRFINNIKVARLRTKREEERVARELREAEEAKVREAEAKERAKVEAAGKTGMTTLLSACPPSLPPFFPLDTPGNFSPRDVI